jgi:transposase
MEKGEMTVSSRRYSRKIALEAVRLAEEGVCRKKIREQFNLGSQTLAAWMRRYGSQEYQQNKRRIYSNKERRTVINAVTHQGMSCREAQIAFGLCSVETVRRWVNESKEEKGDLCVVVEPMAKKKKEQEPEDVAALRRELELAKLKIEALNTLIDVAEDQLKIDIRKKSGARRSSK